MKYALMIVGPPGSGKTTLTQNLIRYLQSVCIRSRTDTKTKLVPYRVYKLEDSTWKIVGVFDDNPLSYVQGTDRLSMGVQPEFEKFLETNEASLIIEGDRLANAKTLDALERTGHTIRVLELKVNDYVLASRYKERGSTQSPTFIKGRKTKIANLMRACAERGVRSKSVSNATVHEANWISHNLQRLMK